MTAGYLLDTNHLGVAVTPGSVVHRRIGALRQQGIKVGTCVPVLCEIEVGVQGVKRPEAYRANLARLLSEVRVWPLDVGLSRLYGEIFHDLRRRGRVLSQVDMMLAAMARQMSLTLVTADQDFAALPDIRTENWIAAAP